MDVLYGFCVYFAVLWLRGWNPDPGRPKTAKNGKKPGKPYKPLKLIRFFAALWLRGWNPDPGRPKTANKRINRVNHINR